MWKLLLKKTGGTALTLLGLFVLAPFSARGQEASENAIKAALLYNFVKFVQWPEHAFEDKSKPIILGILGEDPFGKDIDILKGKTVKNRRIAIKRFERAQDIRTCHILFISTSERERLAEITVALENKSVLTIGEMEDFIRSGGMIKFIIVKDNIRFEINAAAAQQADLKISTQLLKLAASVKTD